MSDRLPPIPITRPLLGEAERAAVNEVLESGWLTQGARVQAFEAAFGERHGVRHAVATTSCTTALQLALEALGIGPGDEVIVPAFTWVASANVVVHQGATPIFADVDPRTYNLDPARLGALRTARTRAVIAVHLFGLCSDVDGIRDALGQDVLVLEDAACAAGAALRSRPAGSLGEVAAFSFHPRKTITTGEGGMCTTNDPELAERMRCLRNHGASVPEEVRHGSPKPYAMPEFDVCGFNYRMTDLQAAVGVEQLKRLDAFVAERRALAAAYDEMLAGIPWISAPHVPEHYDHAYQAYVCSLDAATAPASRDDVLAWLLEHGVSGRAGTHAVTTLGAFRDYERRDDCAVAEQLASWSIALPLYNGMTRDEQLRVVSALSGFRAPGG